MQTDSHKLTDVRLTPDPNVQEGLDEYLSFDNLSRAMLTSISLTVYSCAQSPAMLWELADVNIDDMQI